MQLHIIPRAIAKERNFVRFFTSKPCKNNHIAERNTKSSVCLVCDKEKSALDRASKPERCAEISKKSRIKHASQRSEDSRLWREKNTDRVRENRKKYAEENKEKVALAKKEYYEKNKEHLLELSRKNYLDNKEHYAAVSKKWRKNNKDTIRVNNRNRKDKIKKAGGSHTVKDIKYLLTMQKRSCAYCCTKFDGQNYHVDHIVALARGGSNNADNLQILCPTCNLRKGAKCEFEWANSIGKLL